MTRFRDIPRIRSSPSSMYLVLSGSSSPWLTLPVLPLSKLILHYYTFSRLDYFTLQVFGGFGGMLYALRDRGYFPGAARLFCGFR